jgi:hypothetical protein
VLCKEENKFTNTKLKHVTEGIEINSFGISCKNNDEKLKHLVFHSSKTFSDGQNDKPEIHLTKKLIDVYRDFEVIYNYDDIHLYIFNKSIYALLEDEKVQQLSSLSNEFIPFLTNNSNKRRLKQLIVNFSKDLENLVKVIKIKCHIIDQGEYA